MVTNWETRGLRVVVVVGLVLGLSLPGRGQTSEVVLEIENAVLAPGSPPSAGVFLTHGAPGEVEGFWVGICWDDALPLVLFEMTLGDAVAALGGGVGPDLFFVDADPIGGSGVTCGTVLSFSGTETLPSGFAGEILRMGYQYTTGAPGVVELAFCDHLGAPPLTTQVIVDGASLIPLQVAGSIVFPSPPSVPFRRGDLDANGGLDLADSIAVLSLLFDSASTGCFESADVDANQQVDISDSVALLSHLFVGGAPPAPPYLDCGADPVDLLGCAVYEGCL